MLTVGIMLYKHIFVPDLLWGLHSFLFKGYRVSLLGYIGRRGGGGGGEVDHSCPSSTTVKNPWTYTTDCLRFHGVDRAHLLLLILY